MNDLGALQIRHTRIESARGGFVSIHPPSVVIDEYVVPRSDIPEFEIALVTVLCLILSAFGKLCVFVAAKEIGSCTGEGLPIGTQTAPPHTTSGQCCRV